MLGHVAQSVGSALPGVITALPLKPKIEASWATPNGSSVATLNLSGTRAGDLQVLAIALSAGLGDPTPPADWILLGSTSANSTYFAVYSRVATSNDGNVVFSRTAANAAVISISGAAKLGRFALTEGFSQDGLVTLSRVQEVKPNTLLVGGAMTASNDRFLGYDNGSIILAQGQHLFEKARVPANGNVLSFAVKAQPNTTLRCHGFTLEVLPND